MRHRDLPLPLLLLVMSARLAISSELHEEVQKDMTAEERRFDFGSGGYEIVETLESCYWCGTDTPDTDSEHRAVTITRFSINVTPGTCVDNKSPNYPSSYPPNIDYRWTYTTDPGAVLTFNVPKGGIQKSRGCFRDKLATVVNNVSIRRCGSFTDFTRDSGDTNTIYIRFETNHRLEWQGYSGTVCASEVITTTTPVTTTITTTTTTGPSTTTPIPVLCDVVCGNINGYSGRISDGTTGTHYPWVAIVDIPRSNLIVRCSGVLISRTHVLTIADCFYQQTPTGTDNVSVRITVGDYDITKPDSPLSQTLYTKTIDVYDSFNSEIGGFNNVALLTVPEPGFILNSKVNPICVVDDTIYNGILTVPMSNLPSLTFGGFGWSAKDEPVVEMTNLALDPFGMQLGNPAVAYLQAGVGKDSPCYGDGGSALFTVVGSKYYAIALINVMVGLNCPLGQAGALYQSPNLKFYKSWIDGITGDRYCSQ